jgi:hypothetical protein
MFSLLFILTMCNGCSESALNSSLKEPTCDTLTFKTLVGFLNRNIDETPSYKCYNRRDTVIVGDEGESWKAKAYYKDSELVFIAESSWENVKKISRVTILSPKIKEGNLSINQKFGNIRSLVSPNIPTSPDGYLFVQPTNDSKIFIQLDITARHTDSSLFYGVGDISKIPDDLIIESIIIR